MYRSHKPRDDIIVDEESYNKNKGWAIIKNRQNEDIDISKLSDTFTMQKIIQEKIQHHLAGLTQQHNRYKNSNDPLDSDLFRELEE